MCIRDRFSLHRESVPSLHLHQFDFPQLVLLQNVGFILFDRADELFVDAEEPGLRRCAYVAPGIDELSELRIKADLMSSRCLRKPLQPAAIKFYAVSI